MEAIIITTTVFGSFYGAFLLQKAALERFFHMMETERRARQ
jgi:hypothetical protein